MENKEIWKDIEGYEGLYQISSNGVIRSLDRYVNCPLNGKRLIKGKKIKKYLNTNGYYCICLTKNGKSKHYTIHSVIAKHFIPNPENKPCIDHINTNRTDNRVENLRWVTHKENMNNPITIQKCIKSQKGKIQSKITIEKRVSKLRGKPRPQNVKDAIIKKLSKPVFQFTKDGNFIKSYYSIKDAAKDNGVKRIGITSVLTGRQKTAYGYKWGYVEDYERIPFKIFDLEIYRKKVA